MKRFKVSQFGTPELRFLVVVVLFVSFGLLALYITHATQPNGTVQTESGTTANGASNITGGANISGSGYVKFAGGASSAPVLAAAGDIASNGTNYSFQTATVINSISNLNAVITLGDNAYNEGTIQQFLSYFDPTWGHFKDKIYPGIGNHEYFLNGHAAGFFQYFGSGTAHDVSGKTAWYSFDIGDWHFISLDSDCSRADPGGCSLTNPMNTWLANDLKSHKNKCIAAFWHRPIYSVYFTGQTGAIAATEAALEQQHDELAADSVVSANKLTVYNTDMLNSWNMLYDAGVDVVLNGHTHDYERFKPMGKGSLNPRTPPQIDTSGKGITQITVGTGGRPLTPIPANTYSQVPQLQVYNDKNNGVLKMTLFSDHMDYTFMPVAGGTFTDSGSVTCH